MTDPTEIPGAAGPLAQRYGTDRPRRRWLGLALGGLVAGVLLAWAVWAGTAQDDAPIDAQVTAYDVVGTHEVRVKVEAHFSDPAAGGTCLVRATAEDHTVVGELNLTADDLRAARDSWITIRTERRATTAALVRCTD